jgi:hypothetical protein
MVMSAIFNHDIDQEVRCKHLVAEYQVQSQDNPFGVQGGTEMNFLLWVIIPLMILGCVIDLIIQHVATVLTPTWQYISDPAPDQTQNKDITESVFHLLSLLRNEVKFSLSFM